MRRDRAVSTSLLTILLLGMALVDLEAPAAELTVNAPVERPISAAERDHWAYRPLSTVEPPATDDARFVGHPIDRFVIASMKTTGVEPLPPCGPAVLLRRVYFDLTGLPPAADEVRQFLADRSPEGYEKVVDRLLASQAYGERWAQHWLDLARFAETDGFEHDLLRPNAWRYRDWVIAALNADMPFDEFARLQIAGDELRPGVPEGAVPTGFLLAGPDMPDLNLQDERRHQVLNEMTATVGAVFLGLQFGCAQCHDHKYDPIRLHDFYRLRAFFEPAQFFGDHPIPTADERAARAAAEAAVDPADRVREKRRRELEALARSRFRDKNPDVQPSREAWLAELSDDDRGELAEIVEHLKTVQPLPALPLARVMRGGTPQPGHLCLRGDFRQVGPEIRAGLARVLVPVANDPAADDLPDKFENPRSRLARWLTHADNPLTPRVIVNRLWQWHFGVGLCSSASDFGLMGSPPTHPELLDWLARNFVDGGWSLKRLHRLIVTSQTYRVASGPYDASWSAEQSHATRVAWDRSKVRDPDNTLLWHHRRGRLDAESIRDAMLAASGQLSSRRGGPGIRPPLPPEVTETLLKDQWLVSGDAEDHRRRSIYLFVRRNLRYPMFDVFDRPDTNASCPRRDESTTALQSLALLNSEFSLDCARSLAGRLLSQHPDHPDRRIDEAYLRVCSRPAEDGELRSAQKFLAAQAARLRAENRAADSLALPSGSLPADPWAAAAMVDFCLALLNSSEMVLVD